MLLLLQLQDEARRDSSVPTRRSGSKRRDRQTFEKVTEHLSDMEFRRAFRMARVSFYKLLRLLRHHLHRDELQAARSSGGVISPSLRLAVTLRLLAGGSYLDQMLSFRVGRSTVFAIFKETIHALFQELKMPGIPRSEVEGLQKLADEFQRSRGAVSPLYGCVAALDGIAIEISKPPDDYIPRNFYCRKGMYALPVQACVDARYRFLYMSCKCTGSTHDSVAFAVSNLARELEESPLKTGYWIAADAAYMCSQGVIVPWSKSALQCDEKGLFRDSFNFFHSSLRIHVEQAFGILVRRWGILWRPISFSIADSLPIVSVCMRLHNFVIENDGHSFSYLSSFEESLATEAAKVWIQNTRILYDRFQPRSQGRRSDLLTSTMRDLMTDELQIKGITRPATS